MAAVGLVRPHPVVCRLRGLGPVHQYPRDESYEVGMGAGHALYRYPFIAAPVSAVLDRHFQEGLPAAGTKAGLIEFGGHLLQGEPLFMQGKR